MLDEASRVRLAEMGIDVYLPRAQPAASAPSASPALPQAASNERAPRTTAGVSAASIVLLAGSVSTRARALPGDVVRALKFAKVDAVEADAGDEAALASAAGLVLFGDALARTVGAVLPAQRQREIVWVVTGELSALAGDAQGKRALWSELRRLVKKISSDGASRAMRGAGVVESSVG
jgi:hypothetical protein